MKRLLLASAGHAHALVLRAWPQHQPQRHFLALLATGDSRAIASSGPFGAEGAWVWRWKDHIDHRFLRQFEVPNEVSRPVQSLNSLAEEPVHQPGETR